MAPTTSSSVSSKSSATDIISNLANLLPTGTFLAFQAVAPLFTNNGECGNVEKIMTGLLVLTFSIINALLTFTDSITTHSGKTYYGIVTRWGLYNPQFSISNIVGMEGNFYNKSARYRVNIFDFINGALGVAVFDGLVLLTPPVSTCYFPNIPNTIIKSVPILVGIIAGLYFSFAPQSRRGVGYSVGGLEPVHEQEHQMDPPVEGNHSPQAENVKADQDSFTPAATGRRQNPPISPETIKSPMLNSPIRSPV